MIRITVQITTPAGETIERTRVFHNDEQAGKYRRACEHAGRKITKARELAAADSSDLAKQIIQVLADTKENEE